MNLEMPAGLIAQESYSINSLPGCTASLDRSEVTVVPLTQRADPPKPLRNGNGEEVELKNRLGTLPLFSRSQWQETVETSDPR